MTTAFTQAQTSINNVEAAQIVNGTITDAKLAMLRGVGNSNGTLAQGTGFTPARTGTGAYTITYTAYSAAPLAFVGSSAETEFVALVSTTTTVATINLITRSTGAATDAKFNFMIIASS